MATIETLYSARIDYELTSKGDPNVHPDKVTDICFKTCLVHDVEWESMEGNACCSPYITLECDNRQRLEKAVGVIERYIRRCTRTLILIEEKP